MSLKTALSKAALAAPLVTAAVAVADVRVATIAGSAHKLELTSTLDTVGNITAFELGTDDAATMGVPTSLRTGLPAYSYTFEVAHVLSASEASSGFDVSVRIALFSSDRGDLQQNGAKFIVDSVVILGQ